MYLLSQYLTIHNPKPTYSQSGQIVSVRCVGTQHHYYWQWKGRLVYLEYESIIQFFFSSKKREYNQDTEQRVALKNEIFSPSLESQWLVAIFQLGSQFTVEKLISWNNIL